MPNVFAKIEKRTFLCCESLFSNWLYYYDTHSTLYYTYKKLAKSGQANLQSIPVIRGANSTLREMNLPQSRLALFLLVHLFLQGSAYSANLFNLRFTTNGLFLARANQNRRFSDRNWALDRISNKGLIKSGAKRIALHISRNQSYAKRKKIKYPMRSSKAPFSLFTFLYLSLCDLYFPLRNAQDLRWKRGERTKKNSREQPRRKAQIDCELSPGSPSWRRKKDDNDIVRRNCIIVCIIVRFA